MRREEQTLDWLSHSSFDMETMTWTVLEPMNIGRSGARAIALNGHIYILGGIRYYNVPEFYDPKNDEWHRLATSNLYYHKPMTPFSSNSFLHVRGTSPIMHRYDTSANCWTQVCNFLVTREVETDDLVGYGRRTKYENYCLCTRCRFNVKSSVLRCVQVTIISCTMYVSSEHLRIEELADFWHKTERLISARDTKE